MLLPLVACAILVGGPTPTDRYAWTFLREVDRIFRQDPSDQTSRPGSLPTIHGRQYFDERIPNEKPAVEALREIEKDHWIAFMIYSGLKDGKWERYDTMSGHHQLDWAPYCRTREHFAANDNFYNYWAPDGARKLADTKKLESMVLANFAGDPAKIYFRSMRPNGQTRFSKSSPIFQKPEKGKPMAVLVLVVIEKPKAETSSKSEF